jgi:hypothetical protein
VRPDVAAMVEYGTDTMACQMVIKAQQHLVRREDRFKSVEWETMKSLIDEMVPPNSRGTKINELDESMGCARSDISEYQNVTIELSTRCLTSGADTSTAITFKRAACPKPLTIQLLPTPVERKPQ